jgi:hypothetical protein
MLIFPSKSETIVCGEPCEVVTGRLHNMVDQVDPNTAKTPGPTMKEFSGMIVEDGWQFTRSGKKPGSYQPLVRIRLEKANKTCLVMIRYTLFVDTKRSLIIWSLLSVFVATFFFALYQEWLYGTLTISVGVVNFILARENFRIQLANTRRILHNTLLPAHD